jgi:isopentenyldiphosphate isomerase
MLLFSFERTFSSVYSNANHRSFPYPSSEGYATFLSTFYTLVHNATSIGLLPENVFNALAKVPIKIKGELEVSRSKRTVSCFNFPTEEERSKAVAATCQYWRENKTFKVLAGWRDELYPVYGPGNELLYSIERSASALFGVVTYGVHMTAYSNIEGELKIWVPRRSKTKQTYPGMLDNTVAGGMATGEDPLTSVIREANEEASLPSSLVKEAVKAQGTITYIYVREARAGGEDGLIQPECQYVYDLELPKDVVCKPNDSEVECFYLWSVEEVKLHMANGEFKPNCALLMLDFFIRHGILTQENEKDFEEIKRRLHRRLESPGPHHNV